MNCLLKWLFLFCFFLIGKKEGCSQYILNGVAQKISCNCYTLTPPAQTLSGSVWNSNKINLTKSFDYWFNVYLGCNDGNGADGIVFILQPISTSIGTTGEGMGFYGITPSVGIALDTHQNFNWNDPPYDHISIQANGVINHNNDLAGPMSISANSGNVEDCQWHQLRITWDAAAKLLSTYFDGVPRVAKQVDLVNSIFNNDPNVYWGFTGATGGLVNLQQFCTALDPIIKINAANNTACKDSVVLFSSASVSFAPIVGYNWSFGDGTISNLQNPLPHSYPVTGNYTVHLKIRGQDGCENDTVTTVTIAGKPTVALSAADACFKQIPVLTLDTTQPGISYSWRLDGGASTSQFPSTTTLAPGLHSLELTATSIYNCGPPAATGTSFTVKPIPRVSFQTNDACVATSLLFTGLQLDNATSVTQWNWQFGDGKKASEKASLHSYAQKGTYTVSLVATADNGCPSDAVSQSLKISAASVFAGNDTAIVKGYPFQLNGEGNGTFLWSPAAGLSDATSPRPITTNVLDETDYVLTVISPEGCTASDTVKIKSFKGPAIYVPTAFTPNSDGRNDVLRPVYVGIKELKQFAVFNRWGQLLFSTKNMSAGWASQNAATGTYVWLIAAVNFLGQPVLVKGTVTLIR